MGKWDKNTKGEVQQDKKQSSWKKEWVGKINQYLGTGRNAKDSIIYLVIKYSFIVAGVITVLVIINYWFFRDNDNKVPNIVSDLKVIWEIVTPIITLALGYAFGRNEK